MIFRIGERSIHLWRACHAGSKRHGQLLALAAEQSRPARAKLIDLVDDVKGSIQRIWVTAVSTRRRVSRPWLRPRTPVSSSRRPICGAARSVRPNGDGPRLRSCHLNSTPPPPKLVKLRLSRPGTLRMEKRLAVTEGSMLNP